jgi:hypothetical protein
MTPVEVGDRLPEIRVDLHHPRRLGGRRAPPPTPASAQLADGQVDAERVEPAAGVGALEPWPRLERAEVGRLGQVPCLVGSPTMNARRRTSPS